MLAKSKKPNRKKSQKSSLSRPAVQSAAPISQLAPLQEPVAADEEDLLPVEERVARVLRESGMAPGEDSFGGSSAPGLEDPLSRIPKKGQELLERFFAGGALTFGAIFITAGILVSAEALAKVLGYELPVAVDEALIQYVEPALTPSILILFGFSISLGLLKQLQMGSASAGVLYSEDDD